MQQQEGEEEHLEVPHEDVAMREIEMGEGRDPIRIQEWSHLEVRVGGGVGGDDVTLQKRDAGAHACMHAHFGHQQQCKGQVGSWKVSRRAPIPPCVPHPHRAVVWRRLC